MKPHMQIIRWFSFSDWAEGQNISKKIHDNKITEKFGESEIIFEFSLNGD